MVINHVKKNWLLEDYKVYLITRIRQEKVAKSPVNNINVLTWQFKAFTWTHSLVSWENNCLHCPLKTTTNLDRKENVIVFLETTSIV